MEKIDNYGDDFCNELFKALVEDGMSEEEAERELEDFVS